MNKKVTMEQKQIKLAKEEVNEVEPTKSEKIAELRKRLANHPFVSARTGKY